VVAQVDIRTAGRAFVEALAAQDFEVLRALLAPDVRLRALLPDGPQEHGGPSAAVGEFADWYGDADHLELQGSTVGRVGDRVAISYGFRLHRSGGWDVIEQRIFGEVDHEGRLERLDLLCSGFHPLPEPSTSGVHQFDAGDLGCADGLAGEFRRQIGAIPVGDVLVVAARDPAAREDLPPLARMMGHTVRSVETPGDGRLLVTVERGR
jgi:TusA-related sulfurtransferase